MFGGVPDPTALVGSLRDFHELTAILAAALLRVCRPEQTIADRLVIDDDTMQINGPNLRCGVGLLSLAAGAVAQ